MHPVEILISLSIFLGTAWFQTVPPTVEWFNLTLGLFCLSALIEKATEPMQIMSILKMDLSDRVKVEGLSLTIKCFSIYVFLIMKLDLLAFGLAQLVYSLCVFLLYCRIYLVHRGHSKTSLIKTFMTLQPLETIKKSMAKRESEKIFLTETET
jgi:hypothetical protein